MATEELRSADSADTSRDSIESATWEVLGAHIPLAGTQRSDGTVLRELPGTDSLRLLQCVVDLENRFGIELDDDSVFAARTVGDLIDVLALAIGPAEDR
jgi:acyl carrier protein